MPEQRARQYHRERVGETLKEEIGVIIEGELGDPRIALCNVTEIALAPDNKSARVYIEVVGDDHESEQTITAINAAKGYIKRELLQRMGVRHIPELHFVLDKSQQYGSRIDDLLGRIEKHKKSIKNKKK
jgi:ribosome-binding factor A